MPNTEPIVGAALSFDSLEEQDYEEWVSVSDTRFFVELELNLALTNIMVRKIAKRFNLLSMQDGEERIQQGPFVDLCRKIYFPEIPKGYKPLRYFVKKHGLRLITIESWVERNWVKAQKIACGLQEVWFAEEKDFKRLVDERRNRKHGKGAVLFRKPIGRKQKRHNRQR